MIGHHMKKILVVEIINNNVIKLKSLRSLEVEGR